MSTNQVITGADVVPKTEGGIPKFQATAQMGNPGMSAMQTGINNDQKLAALNKVAQGGARRRRKYRGGQVASGATVLPPGPTPIYNDPSSGTPYGAQNQSTSTMTATLNQNAQAKLDEVKLAPIGGSRRKRRGGVKWGCYSGGKRKSRRHSKKSLKKSRKTRRK